MIKKSLLDLLAGYTVIATKRMPVDTSDEDTVGFELESEHPDLLSCLIVVPASVVEEYDLNLFDKGTKQ